jgi:hypothetical protein
MAAAASSVSSEEAIETAWGDGVESTTDPTGVHATSALLTLPHDDEETPVWIVTFDGTCIPVGGGVGASPFCRDQPWFVAVDAATREVIFAFTDSTFYV